MPKKSTKSAKPRTVLIEKEIVSEGLYPQKRNGRTSLVPVTKERLESMAKTFGEMRERGLRVPAPWKHDFGVTIETGDEGLLQDATVNAGFWERIWTKVNEDGKTVLVGEIEAPGDPNDPNTPAGKIGTQVKDTSIYEREEFVTGKGDKLQNVLMHIALVTHPVESGQKNFELLEPNDSFIAMSEMVDTGDISSLVRSLERVCNIRIPQNTTIETLVANLLIAVDQIDALKKDDEDSDDPSNTSYEVEPIVMATLTKEQAEALLKNKPVNPATGKPFTIEDLTDQTHPDEQKTGTLSKEHALVMSALQETLVTDRRKGYVQRIHAAVEAGQCTKEYAESVLYPKAQSYSLHFEGGKPATPVIEELLMSLEQFPKKAAPQAQGASSVDALLLQLQGLSDDNAEISDADMDKIANEMVSNL